MFNARVLPLSIFTNQNSIYIVVRGFETFDGNTRSDIGEKIECTSERQVKGYMTLSN